MPTIVKTIGPGADFESGQAWADDIESNAGGFYTAGDIAHGQVVADMIGSAFINFKAANATNPIAGAIVSPDPGNEANGQKGVGRLISSNSATTATFTIGSSVDYDVTIRDLEIANTSSNAQFFHAKGIYINTTNDAIEIQVLRNVIHANPHAATDTSPMGIDDRYNRAFLIRCMLEGWSNPTLLTGRGINVGTIRTYGLIDNCSVDGCDLGISTTSTDCNPRNCIVMGGTTCFDGAFHASSNKNMSSDATAPGTVNYRNEVRSSIWTDPDNGDWTLQNGTNATGTGDNLGSTYQQDIDIQNNAVTGDWDLGAYHSGAAPPLPGIPVSGQRRIHTIGF